MKRIHVTNNKIIRLNKKYNQDKRTFKPKGLWYSIDNEWTEWCIDNMPHWVKKHTFELDLDMSNILIISSAKEALNFMQTYQSKIHIVLGINWEAVAEEYDGIEIQNYYSIRYNKTLMFSMNSLWISSWDVNSGCIWNLDILKEIKRV